MFSKIRLDVQYTLFANGVATASVKILRVASGKNILTIILDNDNVRPPDIPLPLSPKSRR